MWGNKKVRWSPNSQHLRSEFIWKSGCCRWDSSEVTLEQSQPLIRFGVLTRRIEKTQTQKERMPCDDRDWRDVVARKECQEGQQTSRRRFNKLFPSRRLYDTVRLRMVWKTVRYRRLPRWWERIPANAGDARDLGLIPGLGRSPGAGNDSPLPFSCLGNPMNRGAWWAIVHGVANSWTRLSARVCVRTHTHTHTHTHTQRK